MENLLLNETVVVTEAQAFDASAIESFDAQEYLDYCASITQEDIDIEEDAGSPFPVLTDPDEIENSMKGGDAIAEELVVDLVSEGKEGDKVVNNVLSAEGYAREELGVDFGKAVTFWKQLRYVGKMTDADYYEMLEAWKILVSLSGDEVIGDSLAHTAESLKKIFCPAADISSYSDEELAEFINDSIRDFVLSAYSERLKKETSEIIKMSMEHIQFVGDANGYAQCFTDTSVAAKYIGDEVRHNKSKMRIVETAEDGISRMLTEKGLANLTVFMGQSSQDKAVMATLLAQKEFIFKNGFTDVATGKHYMFAFQNPSSCRKANFMFVEADTWEEVVTLWLEITGLETWEDFVEAFFDSKGEVNFNKLLARVSTRGSNSFNLSKVSPRWAEEIANLNIDYFTDPEIEITRDFKTLVGPNHMETRTGVARTVTPGDGQMIGSFSLHALIAVAMRVIPESEYYQFMKLWAAAGKDATKVKEGSTLHRLILKIPQVFQIRHGEKKGICVRHNLEAIPELADKDALVPDSVRKFVSGDWSSFPLEICNYSKSKGDYVALNPQFIQALSYKDPNALLPVVSFWFNYMKESLDDIAKAQQFHGIIATTSSSDASIASNLVAAMKTSSDLINDAQVCNWRKDQYRKFIDDMKIGRLRVPGQYSYMICDPALIIGKVYGIELPHLSAGEFYFNAKNCECGLFRSPLIHPFEAQRVQLVNNKAYWYMRDVIVFNGLDGIWDSMGGASL